MAEEQGASILHSGTDANAVWERVFVLSPLGREAPLDASSDGQTTIDEESIFCNSALADYGHNSLRVGMSSSWLINFGLNDTSAFKKGVCLPGETLLLVNNNGPVSCSMFNFEQNCTHMDTLGTPADKVASSLRQPRSLVNTFVPPATNYSLQALSLCLPPQMW